MWTPPERVRHELADESWPTKEQAGQSRLFQALSYRNLNIRHRTWIPAMVPWRATEEGYVTPEVLDWYRRFAQGKPGALVVEATGIRDIPSGPLLRIGDDRFLSGLRELVDVVREASSSRTRLFIQLIDFLSIRRRPSREKYLKRFLTVSTRLRERLVEETRDSGWREAPELAVREQLLAMDEAELFLVLDEREMESLRMGARERVTDIDSEHIRRLPSVLPQLFASAAVRAQEAGFDGVELHFAHAYTMASFLSGLNDRADGYGGSLEGRVRLPLEVYDAVRDAVGDNYVVGCRMLSDEIIDGGSRPTDASYFAKRFARAGMDFLSLSRGGKFEDAAQPKVGAAVYPYTGQSGYECMPTVYSDSKGPFGRNVRDVSRIRAELRSEGLETPLVVAGGIGTFSLAESILERGDADIIASARQSLADPDWFEKARIGRGRDVRRCEYTNYCEALDQRHVPVTCKLWDRIDLSEAGVALDPTGRRRLVAPKWR